ncbi:lytic polysaccharide monooxygenase [Streptomyces sp. MUM 178J]|uniref:lytic polysaccharide monooxygenase n=1 Tax=Streptomyces sp. MUM 178J TaxID=2791991 RepID=UPI001F04B402|nr:lytic polysaccharide monooxygenase [Streptomyces sp. MUM 178J]WRQ78692.1 lytic polysaccharide monooxygenase [Streptomyces sp. MUM 178J]
MTVRRKVAPVAVLGVVPLALAGLSAVPAAAHGSMTDPVSRVSACYAEGPESPQSAACKAAIAASGTQAFYDWNEVNIGDAAGRHRQIVPDGKLCSAGRDKYKGLDLPRADWPASKLGSGSHTFRYKATAPHRGGFELYITKDGYDPTKPLKWSDLEEKPFATVADPKLVNGEYVFEGVVPKKSGRHLIYSIWQRSDSPEAFYTCSDVVFGEDSGGGAPAPAPSAPTEEQIEAGTDESTVSHGGHGGDEHGEHAPQEQNQEQEAPAPAEKPAGKPADGKTAENAQNAQKLAAEPPAPGSNAPEANGSAGGEKLAATGSDSGTAYLAVGGAAVLALGSAMLFATVRRKAVGR